MAINIKGENLKLWIGEHQKQDGGTWRDYSFGINKKNQDGTYVNGYIRAKFIGEARNIPEDLPNGTKCDIEGYIGLDHFVRRDGTEVKNPIIKVTAVKFHDLPEPIDSFDEIDEDVPF